MTKIIKYKISNEQFSAIQSLENWKCFEIPKECWHNFRGIQRLDDTFAIMGSADVNNPKILNGMVNIIAGMDVLAIEKHPYPNELEGNAYHYIFQQVDDPEYPYIMYGPYTKCMAVPHWYDSDHLEVYRPK